MNLKPIKLDEYKNNKRYASVECQQLLSMYDDFYRKVKHNAPWIGYFIVKQEKIVGSCGFIGQPKEGEVEIAYWMFKKI